MSLCVFLLTTLSNFIASFLAVTIGFRLALAHERHATEKSEGRDKRRERKALELLYRELQQDLANIDHFSEDVFNSFYPVYTDSWRALSSSGELTYVENRDLMTKLTENYQQLTQYAWLYERFADAKYRSDAAHQSYYRTLIKIRPSIQKAISEVGRLLEERLRALSKELDISVSVFETVHTEDTPSPAVTPGNLKS